MYKNIIKYIITSYYKRYLKKKWRNYICISLYHIQYIIYLNIYATSWTHTHARAYVHTYMHTQIYFMYSLDVSETILDVQDTNGKRQ